MPLPLAPVATALLTLVAPQQDKDQAPRLLSASDAKSLNKKVQEWFKAWQEFEYGSTTSKQRRAASKNLEKARSAFDKEWASKQKKADLLASIPDVRDVFRNAFEYERTSTSGEFKAVKPAGDIPGYGLIAPRGYDPENAYRFVLLLPTFDRERGIWIDGKEHFDATWKGGASEGKRENIYLVPQLEGLDMDRIPDFSTPTGDADEKKRISALLTPAGQVQREFNVDRERLLLDCGKGSSGFGLRIASYFPDRFAGVIVRWPTDVSHLRLGSLTGLPVLLVASEETKDVAAAIAKQLNEAEQGACTVIEGEGDYPFAGSQAAIDTWVQGIRRNLYRHKVVVEPNYDGFKWGYWVFVGTAEPLDSVAKEDRPRLVAEADRAANRITITAKSISDFALFLNDEIVDLSQPFTVIVNGQAMKEQRERSFRYMTDKMLERYDTTYIWTAQFEASVPKTEPKKTDGN